MGVPQQIAIQGSALTSPPTAATFPSLSEAMDLSLARFYQVVRSQAFGVNVISPSWSSLIGSLGISAVRFLAIRVQSGQLLLRITSNQGAPPAPVQSVIPISDLHVFHNPLSGTEFTNVEVQGSANIEMIAAGDP